MFRLMLHYRKVFVARESSLNLSKDFQQGQKAELREVLARGCCKSQQRSNGEIRAPKVGRIEKPELTQNPSLFGLDIGISSLAIGSS